MLGSSLLRGMTSLFLGLGIGLIGIDSLSGQTRYSMNIQELYDGVDIVVVAVGLFAVGEALFNAFFPQPAGSFNKLSSVHMNKSDWKRSVPAWLRGTLIGFPFGLIPAGGAEIPTFLVVRHREEALQPQATSSARWAPSKAWRAPRPPTTPP